MARAGRARRLAAAAIVAVVVAVHAFRLGSHLQGDAHRLYYAYASDVLVPLAAYFMLVLSEHNVPPLRDWRPKALVVLAVASGAEALQAAGIPALGRTFDPVDFAMYAAGTLLAVLIDRLALRPPAAAPTAFGPRP